jgi:transketolase
MRFDPHDYKNPARDRLVLSKGHAGCLLYNICAEMGIYSFEELYTGYNQVGKPFGQHPNRLYLPMFEASTGSLGHGLSIAFGMAMALQTDGSDSRVFCITCDGELDEGSNWEALMAAAHYQTANLILIVDRNHLSGSRNTEVTIALEPLCDKLRAFNWDVVSMEGNNMRAIVERLDALPPRSPNTGRKPLAILADTVKGKGVDFMENNPAYHVAPVSDEQLQRALSSIDKMYQGRAWHEAQ